SDRLHLLCLAELPFGLAQRLLRALALQELAQAIADAAYRLELSFVGRTNLAAAELDDAKHLVAEGYREGHGAVPAISGCVSAGAGEPHRLTPGPHHTRQSRAER